MSRNEKTQTQALLLLAFIWHSGPNTELLSKGSLSCTFSPVCSLSTSTLGLYGGPNEAAQLNPFSIVILPSPNLGWGDTWPNPPTVPPLGAIKAWIHQANSQPLAPVRLRQLGLLHINTPRRLQLRACSHFHSAHV